MAESAGYYRHPTIHGEKVVFVSEDDLWAVDAAGGVARRLTANPGIASFPVFSPDGMRIAYTGRDDGPAEAYVIDGEGGDPRRVTWLGALTATVAWTPDSHELIVASDARQPFRGYAHLHAVRADGTGAPRALRVGPARAIAFEPRAASRPEDTATVGARLGAKSATKDAARGPAKGENPAGSAKTASAPKGSAGGVVIGRNSGDPARWKRYRGGTAGTIWIDRQGDGNFVPLVVLEGNLASPMWLAGRIWFLSDHEGHGNLYSCTPAGDGLRRHTHHEEAYVRFPSTDGRRIVYHAGADLYVYDPASPEGRRETRLDVRLHSARPQRARRFVAPGRWLESADLHPEGHSVAAVVRGGVHAVGLWDAPPQRLGTRGPVRYRLARWLPDGKRIVAVSDEGGEESLVVLAADGSTPPQTIATDVGRPLDVSVAPAGPDRVAITNERQELLVVDVMPAGSKSAAAPRAEADGARKRGAKGAAAGESPAVSAATKDSRLVERSPFDRIDGLAWSPDGRYLAYGFADSRRTSSIHVYDLDEKQVRRVTRPDFRDGAPSFDPEGKWLYFVSFRVFDPVYDVHYFDLGFSKGSRPCLVPLRKDLTSPFPGPARAPRAPGAPADAGKDAKEKESTGKESATKEPAPNATAAPTSTPTTGLSSPAPVRIDFDGIEERVLAFPVPEARYVSVLGAKGRVLMLSIPVAGSLEDDSWRSSEPPAKGVLEAWEFADDKSVPVADRVTAASLSANGKTLLLRSGRRLRAVPSTVKSSELSPKDDPGRETGWVDLERLRVAVSPGDEWRQMFREAWRLQRDQFWTPDLSGIDWVAVHDRYLPLVDRVATRAEFSDLLWELQGELGTSHCYEMGGEYRPSPSFPQGFLGADVDFDASSGTWKVTRVPRGDSWDAGASSPLAAPGALVEPGEELESVDGERLSASVSPSSRLVHAAGKDVRIVLRRAGGEPRSVALRALRDEQPLRYRDWVESNRARVHAASGGRIGYVHVPDMGPHGYAEFHRYYSAEVDFLGLVVDVRWNGGGHVSQLLLEKLARKRRGYSRPRWMSPSPYPDDAPMGPMVAITNEYAGSDGDMFSHNFKGYGLGPLVGKRTWGGVVGIWPRHSLVDGTITTQPEFAFWFEDVGYGIEGHGTDPDVEVEITPADHAAGRDPQLERAIALVLSRVDEVKPGVPDFGPKPKRSAPRLPKV